MFKRILAPIDGSAPAGRAIQAACDLAGRYGASLTFLHVVADPGSLSIPPQVEAYARIEHVRASEHEIIEEAARGLLASAEAEAMRKGVKAATLLEFGDPASIISDHVRKDGIDLLIMGRRGLSRIGGLLLGSVSSKVAQLADCTCVTVK
ncbi:MAG: universal stress protein [Alphaproteobacteria bacterium]|nr:universal stress protein [Alphaproteobacteria bacterium]